MARDRYHYSAAHAHARPATQRVVIVFLIVAGISLLVLARAGNPTLVRLRLAMLDLLAPVMQVVAQPVSATRELARNTKSVLETAEENRQLKAENETLRHWQSVAQALKAENTALRALTGYAPVEAASYVTGRVIGQSPSQMGQFLTINVGAEHGVQRLQPVVDAFGLVGRTIEVGEEATRVMLLSDVGSRVPVITGTSRQRAIVSGGKGELLRLSFLNEDAKLTLGEPVVTTQEGALIPGGIAVGTLFQHDAEGYWVKPARALAQSEYVRVVQTGRAVAPGAAPAATMVP